MTAPNKMAKRAAAGTLALAVCLTGGVLGSGAANAALPDANEVETVVDDPTFVVPGKDGQPVSDLAVILDQKLSRWAVGDRIVLELPAGSASTLEFGALPSASIDPVTSASGVRYAPTVSVSKVPARVGATSNSIAITFTNASPATVSTTDAPVLALEVTGLKLDVAASRTVGPVEVDVYGQEPTSGTTYDPAVFELYGTDTITRVEGAGISIPETSFEAGTGTKTLPTITITEGTVGAFGSGAITVQLSSGTVVADGGTSVKVTGSANASAAVATPTTPTGSFTVTPTGLSATTLDTITVSGLKYTPGAPGPVAVTLDDSGAVATSLSADVEASEDVVVYPKIARAGGADRYETAEIVADALVGGKTDHVVLTNGGLGSATGISIDALTAAYLAGSPDIDTDEDGTGPDTDTDGESTPILLTDSAKLPTATRNALLKSLEAGGTVTILGGTTAVNESVVEEIQSLGFAVDRVSGTDRYDSAAKAAIEADRGPVRAVDLDGAGPIENLRTAILASGTSPVDALAASQISYDLNHPTLLTEKSEVPKVTLDALKELDVERVVIVGGEAVIAPSVKTQLEAADIEVIRIAGEDRYETSAALIGVAEAVIGAELTQNGAIHLANGAALADASVAAPLAATLNFGVFFTEKDALPESTRDVIVASDLAPPGADITQVIGVGGTTVLPQSTLVAANVLVNEQVPLVP